ncbi:peptidase dimerization domain-containing protein, partial [Clostridioides difficile]
RIQKLTNLDVGTTVSVSVIKGGRVENSIPEDCSIKVDLRFEKAIFKKYGWCRRFKKLHNR